MDNKDKIIEEMAKVIGHCYCDKECKNKCAYCDISSRNEAKKLYENGFRKLPEDSVVLTKEEQEQMNNELRYKIYQACKMETQKTAEKILNHFVKEFPILKTRVVARELAKQYGVEVE